MKMNESVLPCAIFVWFLSECSSVYLPLSPHSYEVMRKCWDEKFEKRPEFSFLVQALGNMLSDAYKKVSAALFSVSLASRFKKHKAYHVTHRMHIKVPLVQFYFAHSGILLLGKMYNLLTCNS